VSLVGAEIRKDLANLILIVFVVCILGCLCGLPKQDFFRETTRDL